MFIVKFGLVLRCLCVQIDEVEDKVVEVDVKYFKLWKL